MARKRRVIRDSVSQIGLFTGKVVKPPTKLSERLHQEALISKHSGKTNVLKAIDKAFASIQNFKGVNIGDMIEAMKGNEPVSVESVLKAAVRPIRRSPAEKETIRRAITTIVAMVNRKKKADFLGKEYAPSKAEYGENARQKNHLKSIGEK